MPSNSALSLLGYLPSTTLLQKRPVTFKPDSFWREICIVRFQIVNLARSAAFAYAITILIPGLSSLFQLSGIMLYLNRKAHHNHRQRLCEMLTFSQPVLYGRSIEKKSKRCFWFDLEELVSGGTTLWKALCLQMNERKTSECAMRISTNCVMN